MARRKKKKDPVAIVFVFIIIGVLGFLAYKYGPRLIDYKESRDAFKGLEQYAEVIEEKEEAEPVVAKDEKGEEVKIEGPVMDIDWEGLGKNCVGWLLMDDISYPIMYSGDNDYYLHRLPDGTWNYGGSIFLGMEHKTDFTGQNSFVYGHNMNDGSMFGKLKKYDPGKESFKERGTCFYIFTPDGKRHKYDFFTILSVEGGSTAYYYNFPTKKQFLDYQKEMQSISLYKSDLKPDKNARLVSLSTCNGYEGTPYRMVIQGMEIEVVVLPKKS